MFYLGPEGSRDKVNYVMEKVMRHVEGLKTLENWCGVIEGYSHIGLCQCIKERKNLVEALKEWERIKVLDDDEGVQDYLNSLRDKLEGSINCNDIIKPKM